MRRRLVTLGSVLSLLLCVLLCVLWARSLGHRSDVRWVRPGFSMTVAETDGVLSLNVARDDPLRAPKQGHVSPHGWWHWRSPLRPGRDRASLTTRSFNSWRFGFHLGRSPD